jgi:uncharacterized membrane protein YgdD (TMEM256/DUF423 family)
MIKFWLVLAAVSGFLTVALGALGAHSLKNVLSDYGRSIFEKAVLYQMFHTLALLGVGALQAAYKDIDLSPAGFGFLAGIVLFSGSLYVLAVTGLKWLGAVTPVGGLAFLFGWAWLIYSISKGRL